MFLDSFKGSSLWNDSNLGVYSHITATGMYSSEVNFRWTVTSHNNARRSTKACTLLGFQDAVLEQLAREAKLNEIEEWQKFVYLTYDEMKIKEGLVYRRWGTSAIK